MATGADPWLAADWPAPSGVTAFTTLRHGAGVSLPPFDSFNFGLNSGDDASAVRSNRGSLASLAGLPTPPCWLRQVHGTQVVRFGETAGHPSSVNGKTWHEASDTGSPHVGVDNGGVPEADASVTAAPGVVLAILTADCLPVVFAAKDGREVGAAHAGWRGLAGGVLEATIAAMATPATQLQAWLGPAAGPEAYEVGAEVREAFIAGSTQAAAAFVATRPGHWKVDLYALARQRLLAAGIGADSIHGGGLCTISDAARFYSHRRDQRTGRMATLAWIHAPR
ncbi:peptidoglycan editing factor PgeF [Luteimonas sp. MHLX1A]|uniref:peptidoglycan editing factor PgeF n=1 Tax=Alterluteimonas muca TaxID=2878684 RepID=UPI001E62FFC4|nr:peptidoglycan editing factor PgeF [Luteimonas sp. MHLX1A]MCD9047451.1 peptidoglycan editing factor PgeF [Luteimonas sp. MHLX1A]